MSDSTTTTTSPVTARPMDDGYRPGDEASVHHEPGDGAIVLARYAGHDGRPDYEKVWRRDDEAAGHPADKDTYTARWFEIRTPSAYCTHCKTTRELGSTGPDSWGVVHGQDDEEPYGDGVIVLWPGGDRAPTF